MNWTIITLCEQLQAFHCGKMVRTSLNLHPKSCLNEASLEIAHSTVVHSVDWPTLVCVQASIKGKDEKHLMEIDANVMYPVLMIIESINERCPSGRALHYLP